MESIMFAVPFLNIPIISVVLLLLAGILIGHLIWYRDRTDDEAMLQGFRSENNELQAALHEHKQAYVGLEADLEDRQKEWNQLRSTNKQLELAHQATDQDLAELNNEIARLQQLKDQAFHDLDQERQKRRAVQEALSQAEENTTRVNNLTAQLQSQVSAFQDERNEIDQLTQARLSEREGEQTKLREQLAQANQEREALLREASELKARLEQQQNESDTALAEQYERTHEAMEAARSECEVLKRERDEMQTELMAARTDADQLKQQFETDKLSFSSQDSQQIELIEQQMATMQTEYDAVQAERNAIAEQRDAAHEARETLQAEYETLTEQRDRAKQDFKELQESVEAMQAQTRSQEASIVALREERDEFVQQVDDQRRSREEIEGQVRNMEQLITQRDDALQRATELEGKLDAIQGELESARQQLSTREAETVSATGTFQVQIDELRSQNAGLQTTIQNMTQEHEAVTAMLVDERSRLSKMESDNHRLSVVAGESSQLVESAQSQVKKRAEEHAEELTRLRTELEETAALLSRERHQREHLQNVLHEKKTAEHSFEREREKQTQSLQETQKQNQVLHQHSEALHSLQGEHASVKRMLSLAHDQLSTVQRSHDTTLNEHRQLESRISELASQNSDYVRQIAKLSTEKSDLTTEIDRLEQTHSSALDSRMALESRVEHLGEENRAIQERLLEAKATRESFLEQKERLERIIAQRDEAMSDKAEHQTRVAELQAQAEAQSRDLSSLHQQNDQLRQMSMETDELRNENLRLQTQIRESGDRLRILTSDREENQSSNRDLQERVGFLEARAKVNEETIRNLRRERAAVVTRSRQPFFGTEVRTNPIRNQSVPEDESGGRMRRDEVLGLVYTQPPKRKDDLKRISGIAQVLEKKLNAFGVYTFRQIMEWDNVAIAEFSKLLAFRDRIERDDWTGQARNLFYDRYGRAA